MRVLLDEDVPRKLIAFLPGHEIETVVSMGWGGVKNGALLTLIERAQFQVFLTGDKNMESQQQLQAAAIRELLDFQAALNRLSQTNFRASRLPLAELLAEYLERKRNAT